MSFNWLCDEVGVLIGLLDDDDDDDDDDDEEDEDKLLTLDDVL